MVFINKRKQSKRRRRRRRKFDLSNCVCCVQLCSVFTVTVALMRKILEEDKELI